VTAVRQLKRKAAKRPQTRTVTVTGPEGYEEWECTARADFPVRWIIELTAEPDAIVRFFDRIVVSHNFPDEQDEVAASLADVDPWDGLLKMSDAIVEAIGNLPNR
jgi:hypothetical protein